MWCTLRAFGKTKFNKFSATIISRGEKVVNTNYFAEQDDASGDWICIFRVMFNTNFVIIKLTQHWLVEHNHHQHEHTKKKVFP